jgi:hypothetical protein
VLTLDQQIALQEVGRSNGRLRLLDLRDALAHFLVDEAGHYKPFAEAVDYLGGLTGAELREVAESVNKALEEDAVPPANGTSSTEPSSTAGPVPGGSKSSKRPRSGD